MRGPGAMQTAAVLPLWAASLTGVVTGYAVGVGVTVAGLDLHGHVVAARVAAHVQAVRVPTRASVNTHVFRKGQMRRWWRQSGSRAVAVG
jgi:hypothetical protein